MIKLQIRPSKWMLEVPDRCGYIVDLECTDCGWKHTTSVCADPDKWLKARQKFWDEFKCPVCGPRTEWCKENWSWIFLRTNLYGELKEAEEVKIDE